MDLRELEAVKVQSQILKFQKIISVILTLNIFLIIYFGSVSILAAQQAESKVDLRYFNMKEVIAMTHNVWVNEYTKEKYTTEEEYKASLAKQKNYHKRTLMQKWFKSLSKGS